MKRAQTEHGRWLQSMTEAVNPKHGPRLPVEFRLMYSAKNHSGETGWAMACSRIFRIAD